MKAILVIAGAILAGYALFMSYRVGLSHGRSQMETIAPAIEAATRFDEAREKTILFASPEIWKGLSQENFLKNVDDNRRQNLGKLMAAFRFLDTDQRDKVIHQFWSSFSEAEERDLRAVPGPTRS